MQYTVIRSDDYLAHHGVKGQKWGVHRYQNEDGSLTAEGQKQREKIEKWYNSKSGQRERQAFSKKGYSDFDAYQSHRQGKAALIGHFIGGIGGNIIGQVVSRKRTNAGKEWFEAEIARLNG